jgi:hypothetical protein
VTHDFQDFTCFLLSGVELLWGVASSQIGVDGGVLWVCEGLSVPINQLLALPVVLLAEKVQDTAFQALGLTWLVLILVLPVLRIQLLVVVLAVLQL